jgi:hypothetical protein
MVSNVIDSLTNIITTSVSFVFRGLIAILDYNNLLGYAALSSALETMEESVYNKLRKLFNSIRGAQSDRCTLDLHNVNNIPNSPREERLVNLSGKTPQVYFLISRNINF